MGNRSEKFKQINSKVLPKFWYVNRFNQRIVLFNGTEPVVHAWPEEIPCYLNSAVCLMNEKIYIAGGTNISGQVQSSFMCFDTKNKAMRILQDLPIHSKFGYLKPYKNAIFYVGAISFEETSKTKIQTPFLKYSLHSESWAIIRHPQLIIGDYLLKDLRKPGFFRIKSKLVLFGGYFKKEKRRQSNSSVISFDLKSANFKFTFENFTFPLEIYQPVTGEYKNKAFVAGGKLVISSYNENSFEFSNSVFTPNSKSFILQENHPVIYQDSFIILFSYPKVHIHDNFSKAWLGFSIPTSPAITTRVVRELYVKYHTESVDTLGISPVSFDSSCALNSFTGDQNLIHCDNKLIEFVSRLDTDEMVSVSLKKALRLFALVSVKLEKKRFTALDANQVSSQVGYRPTVSISEISNIFSEILQKKKYLLESILKYHKGVNGILEKPRTELNIIQGILKFKIDTPNEVVGQSTAVFILTRIIKLAVVGI